MIKHVVSIDQNASLFNIKKAIGVTFLPIFLALFVSNNLDQHINSKVENILRSQDGFSSNLWMYISISLISSLFFPLFLTLIACFGFGYSITAPNLAIYKPKSFSHFFSSTFELSFLESIRAIGVSFLWGFLLIIPGLIKYSFYLLTPFVVFFSKKYQNGEVDALELSEMISKRFWGKLNTYIIIFVLIIPAMMTLFFDEYLNFNNHFFSATALTGVSSLVIIAFHYVILKNFLRYLTDYESLNDLTPNQPSQKQET